MLVSPNSLILLGVVTLSGVYAMYFAACRRYQEHGIKLWGNEPGGGRTEGLMIREGNGKEKKGIAD